jgi:hypothetical protein
MTRNLCGATGKERLSEMMSIISNADDWINQNHDEVSNL